MRIASLIALQSGVVAAAGVCLGGAAFQAHSEAVEARALNALLAIECERFERVAELSAHLMLLGDLVLSGRTTYLAPVAEETGAVLRDSMGSGGSGQALVAAGAPRHRISAVVGSMCSLIEQGSKLDGEDREERLLGLLQPFDTLCVKLDDALLVGSGALISARNRARATAEQSSSKANSTIIWAASLFGLVVLGLWSYLRRTIQHPLVALTRAAERAGETGDFKASQGGPAEVDLLSRRFGELVAGMQGALHARGAFLANTSHELRTPLNAILGYAELLSDDRATPAEIEEGLANIRRSGAHLLGLIEDVLDLSKIDAECMVIERIAVAPRELLDDVHSILGGTASEKGIDLEVSVSRSVPPFVSIDPVRLRQIVVNVVGNALKFTSEGGVRVTCDFVDDELSIRVEDSGIGIPSDRLDSVFETFRQVDSSSTRHYGGTGLGLPISRRLARLMGGDLTAASEAGRGSVFSLRVAAPLSDAGPVAPLPGAHSSSESTERERQPLRILVVDDVAVNRRLCRRILERAGHSVVTADDGQAAVSTEEQARGEGVPFDVILMDLQMPRMCGVEATRTVFGNGYPGSVIALTAAVLPAERTAALDAGCCDFVAKPFAAADLHAAIAACSPAAVKAARP